MKKITNILAAAALTLTLAGCNDDIEMRRPPKFVLPELPDVGNIHTYKAPLYWSVYEYCYTKEQAGVSGADMDISAEEWDKIIDWVATDLKPHGYDMICTDGFIPMLT